MHYIWHYGFMGNRTGELKELLEVKFFKYGTNYKDLKIEDIWEAAKEIYKDYPELLKAARKTLFG